VEPEVETRAPQGAPSPVAPGWRAAIGAAGALNLAVVAVVVARPGVVADRWPWELTRLSELFLAAMFAAVAATALWVAASGSLDGLPAGFANLTITLGGIAVWLAVTGRGVAALVLGVVAIVDLVLLVRVHAAYVARRGPSSAALHPVVRASFLAFTVVLLGVGLALLLGWHGVMPWSVEDGTAVVFGWIFVGDAVFFAYPLVWPGADGGRTQLAAFLGYDLVLLPPLAATLGTVDADRLPGLVVYLGVLVVSALLALWWLPRRPAPP
jgi:hypothetical protein